MRLSEAIALGRTLCVPIPHAQDDGGGGGCALGMAARARGDKWNSYYICEATEINIPAAYPCKCKLKTYELPKVGWIIAHLFNEHVFGTKDWTLDQLIDWVRSVEPEETPSLSEAVATQLISAEVCEKNLIES